jgi:hypothetical protein
MKDVNGIWMTFCEMEVADNSLKRESASLGALINKLLLFIGGVVDSSIPILN